tara:strand:- start:12 stop:941 length:930 start_codon:yes stop_codon:yes gene_type:complete
MISRRHIRIKVMQSLYSYFSQKESSISISEKEMLKHIENINELHNVLLSLLLEIFKYAETYFEDNKKKFLPSSEDLNPNTKFTDNFIFKILKNSSSLLTKMKKSSSVLIDNDHDLIRKIFIELIKSETYAKFILLENSTKDDDVRFINNILNNHILNNHVLHHVLEENSIYWIDDLPFVATIIMGNFKLYKLANQKSVFKNLSDKNFSKELFSGAILNNEDYEKVIIDKSKNWDLERIALMDQILIKMAFCEILNMEDLPVKVTLNEYIEISKYYSTTKSKMFVNGLLDNAINDFKSKNMIKKSAKGLL